jgi:hypothetical protein
MLLRNYKEDNTFWAPLNMNPVNEPRHLKNFIERCINYGKSIKSFGFVKEVKE